MRVEFIEKNSDHDKPVIDISAESYEDSFKLGVIFGEVSKRGLCIWYASSDLYPKIRIPLVEMDEIGLAITYKKGGKQKDV